MMRLKALISVMLAVLHISIMLWYYSHDLNWVIENAAFASFIFFGICFILIGMNMYLTASNRVFPIQVEITKFHSIFVMLLGTIYALHYSGLMITTNREKLIMICAGVLTIVVIIVVSAWRHGFFNKHTYDG